MSAVSDSEVTFRAKALQHGIPESSLSAWSESGIKTYSQLLFRVASAPNNVDSAKLQELLQKMVPQATDQVASAVHTVPFRVPQASLVAGSPHKNAPVDYRLCRPNWDRSASLDSTNPVIN